MSKPFEKEQELFELIVLHNKLMSADDVRFFFKETPDPEDAVQRIVASNMLELEVARKVMGVYRKKLPKLHGSALADADVAPVPAAHHDHAEADPSREEPAVAIAPPPATEPDLQDIEGAIEVEGFEAEQVSANKKVRAIDPEEVVGERIEIADGGRRLIHQLLKTARDMNASDIYIKSNSPAIVRLFTVLKRLNMYPPDEDLVEKSLCSILTEQQLKTFKETSDLDFSYDAGPGIGRFRANLFRQYRGVDGVFRLVADEAPTFEDLNLPDVIRKLTQYRVGIVLVTGPKGSGKTTSLAAMIDLINSTRKEHIITVEDPIEFVQPCKMGHVNQREVGPHTHSFANALRSALREAPDVIMVGEMRDLETTSLAITAAETGHLVLSTLHTPDATRTIGRLLDVFPPKEQPQIRAMVSESLRGVISQQLIPNADRTGMELALEIMINTTAIANLIREDRAFQLPGVIQTGKRWGMCLMDESLISLAKAGRIHPDDAIARANNRTLVVKELGG